MLQDVTKLKVLYNSKLVGFLVELENNEIGFQYDDDWIKNGFSISPFSLPLSNKVFINKKQTFDGLYGVFWDTLPDGWGELLVRRMLTKKGINFDRLTPLQKLSIINKNGLGALEYEPCKEFITEDYEFDLDEIAKETQKILNDDNFENLDLIYKLGGSSGGARPKAHIKIKDEEWIIKFPCLIDPKNIGEIEYKANLLAKKCDIDVNEFNLFPSKICSGYFGTKRFDRKGNKKVHMLSLSAILETTHRLPNLDYNHLFQVIQQICIDKEDMYEAFKRMCFNVLYKNRDDHGKNFAFIYDKDLKSYRLSPFYDITTTPNKLEHEMTINGKGLPTEEDLLKIVKNFNLSIKKCKDIIKTIKNIIDNH